MGFVAGLLLPESLLRIEEEPDAVQREIERGRCRVAGAVDGFGVCVAAEHVAGLILDAFAVDLDDRVGAHHADPVPRTRRVRTGGAVCSVRWADGFAASLRGDLSGDH